MLTCKLCVMLPHAPTARCRCCPRGRHLSAAGKMLLANPSFSNWEKTNLELFDLLTGSEHEVQAAHVLEELNFDPRTRERSRPLAQLTGLDASLSNRVDLECFDGKVICVLRWRARFMCDARTSPLILSLLALCVCQGAAITIPHEVGGQRGPLLEVRGAAAPAHARSQAAHVLR